MSGGQADRPQDGRRDITNVCHGLPASPEQLEARLGLRRSNAAARWRNRLGS